MTNYRYLLSWFYKDGSEQGIGTGYVSVPRKIREEDVSSIIEKIKEEYHRGYVDLLAFSLCDTEARR